MKPAVSVVIPAYNAASTLDATLGALAVQASGASFEVLVADNGSTDDTAAVARRWADRLPLRVVDASARRGQASARNVAASLAEGDILVFTDADDVVFDGWLAAWQSLGPEVEFATGPVVVFSADSAPPRSAERVASGAPEHMGYYRYALGTNFAVRRQLFEQHGGFDVTMPPAEDVELSWRLQDAGVKLVYLPSAVLAKRDREGVRHVVRQYYHYGLRDPALYRRFRDRGAPGPDLGGIARSYLGIVARLPLLFVREQRVRWARQLGRRAGRAVGSMRERVLYP